jgi:hypothetical protein
LHGIERHRQMHGPPGSQGGITRIVVRYSDGRVLNFVPDARRGTFSEDDILELKKVLDTSSSTAEWAEISDRLGS